MIELWTKRTDSIEKKLRSLLLSIFLMCCVIIGITLALFIIYNVRYSNISVNIARVSQFNQNFKEDVDLRMYYYVSQNDYAEGLPLEEVETAQALAQSLLDNTESKESRKAINSVLNLCANLKTKILEIAETDGYDAQIEQLETNIYVLTELVQQYMYTYLYYEAGRLAALQQTLNDRLLLEVLLICIGAVVMILVMARRSLTLSRSITQPIDELCHRAESIGRGDLTAREPVAAEDETLQTLSEGLEKMAARLNRLMELNRQEQTRLYAMELALLQSQINPHFLYNTLDTIIWLIEMGKEEQAVEMVSSLSNFFRTSLSKGSDVITMQEEELQVRSYLEIQQVRYKDILTYDIQMDPALVNLRIPKLTLQPLVENALYHGIKLKRGVGSILVRSKLTEENVVILEVQDTGAGMTQERLHQVLSSMESKETPVGFGLATVYKRLQLFFGEQCKIEMESEENMGTVVRFRFPLRKEAEQA
ncbi:MAG: sensor histidine kinase [Eubacteriales bacterium]|nr:sensor histidine kinase [Eubacteriales bacterium]